MANRPPVSPYEDGRRGPYSRVELPSGQVMGCPDCGPPHSPDNLLDPTDLPEMFDGEQATIAIWSKTWDQIHRSTSPGGHPQGGPASGD